MKKTVLNETLNKSKEIKLKHKPNMTEINKAVPKAEAVHFNLKNSNKPKEHNVPSSLAKLAASITKSHNHPIQLEYKKKHISPPHKLIEMKHEDSKSRLAKSSVVDLKKKISPDKVTEHKLSIKAFSGLKSRAGHNSSIKKINSSAVKNQSKENITNEKQSLNSTNSKNLANLLERTILDMSNLTDVPSEFIDKFRDFLSEKEKEEIRKLKRIYFVGKIKTKISK